ncbi:MAG: helix-turn-helix transcriptional regulator [Clostridia bacterium]|nr:helix-turn-helix transcriptional regulator [Clostridia bacterium]
MDIWFSTFGKGYAPPGWHINHFKYVNRIYVILSGTAYFLYPDKEIKLIPGYLYLFPHRLPFRVRQDESDPVNHLYFDFVITPPFVGDSLIEIPLASDSLIDHTVQCLLMTMDQPQGERMRLIKGYFESLVRLILIKNENLQWEESRLSEVFRCIHEEYNRTLTDADLANLVHLDKNYFIRMFKKAVGLTPYQYLREYRLNRAVVKLQGGMSVEQAAVECGYESAFSLSHAMKKSRGISPSSLKERGKNG